MCVYRLLCATRLTPRHATPRHATPRHATPRHATPRHATPRHATPRHATPRHVTPPTLQLVLTAETIVEVLAKHAESDSARVAAVVAELRERNAASAEEISRELAASAEEAVTALAERARGVGSSNGKEEASSTGTGGDLLTFGGGGCGGGGDGGDGDGGDEGQVVEVVEVVSGGPGEEKGEGKRKRAASANLALASRGFSAVRCVGGDFLLSRQRLQRCLRARASVRHLSFE